MPKPSPTAAFLRRVLQNGFFIKLIMTTALIAIIPGLISNCIAYYKVSQSFREETGTNKLQYLNQTINAIEMVLNRIKDNSNQLALNRSFQNFERFPGGSYYEELQGEISPENLSSLYAYLEAKKNSLDTINMFRMSNEFVDSVYFYDAGKQLVLTSENDGSNLQFPFGAFYDLGWYEAGKKSAEIATLMDTRIAKQRRGPDKHLLSVIYKTGKGDNALIINLNASAIYEKIINKLARTDEMYVVSREGSLLFHSNPAYLHQPVNRILPDKQEIAGHAGFFTDRIQDEQKLVCFSASSLLSWTFVSVSDMKALAKGTTSIKQTIVLSALLLVVLSVVLAYLSSLRLYKPVTRLKALIGWEAGHRAEDGDEFGTIGHYMRSALHERDYYKGKLEESMPIQREQFKAVLLRRHHMSLEEIEAKIHYLHLGIDTRDLVVMALSVDAQGERSTGREEDANLTEDLLKLQVQDLLSRNPVLSTPYYVVEAEENLLALVLARRGMDEEQVLTLARQLLKQINGELNPSYSIGIGSACATVKELPQSYEEALEALKYRILYGSGDVLSFGEIQFDQTSRFHYPKLKEEQLLGYLKTARVEEAVQAFDEFVSDINAQKNNLHYKQIQPVFVQLLTVIIYSLNQLGVNWRTVWQEEANPYQELLDQESLSQIVRWFHQLIRLTAAYLEGEWNAKGNQHITRVIEILERDYSQPLSLSSVAEQVNLNPAYISRLFKQIKGEPFVDYLKKVRIEKSKELLLQSSMKIGEAGKEVGYSHSYYFIKVFKEEVGLTPGEFKRLYGS